jgi:hypothetical protein
MHIRSVVAHVFPYDRTYDLYQEPYRLALKAFCDANGLSYSERSYAYSDNLLRKLRVLRYSYKLSSLIRSKRLPASVDVMARVFSKGPLYSADSVGIYELTSQSGETRTVCIDARDTGDLSADRVADSALYFKTNFWPSRTYPADVVPLPNVNPLVFQDMTAITALRATQKTTDLFAFFRIWGGADEVDGIEHNLLLIESLAKVPCKKYLCAYLVAGDVPALAARLESQGIDSTTKPMAKMELWQRAAEARLNLVRLGMHECIPWRMTDVFAMGGCPVIDYGPQTLWPDPLIEDHHFLSLHSPKDGAPNADIPERVAGWLATPGLVEDISRNTAEYFDQHLRPALLGENILTRADELFSRGPA